MNQPTEDRAAFLKLIRNAVAEIDAIGPRPLGKPGPMGRRIHPDEGAWEQKVADVGREFYLSTWQIAKAGNASAQGYLGETKLQQTDEMAAEYAATKINARWAEAIRAML